METARPKSSTSTTLTLVVLLVLIAVAWRGCWYATRFTDDEIARLLDRNAPVAELQKALLQVHDRLEQKDESAERFLPGVIGQIGNPTPQIRATVAWVLGTRPDDPALAEPLARLVGDDVMIVRYNAALALASRGDTSVRPVLRAMLEKEVVRAAVAGTLESPRARGEAVKVGTVIGRITTATNRVDVLSPIEGTIARAVLAHGDAVEPGVAVIEIEPAMGQIANAAAALGKVGTSEDVPILKELVEGARPIDDDARHFAALAIRQLLAAGR